MTATQFAVLIGSVIIGVGVFTEIWYQRHKKFTGTSTSQELYRDMDPRSERQLHHVLQSLERSTVSFDRLSHSLEHNSTLLSRILQALEHTHSHTTRQLEHLMSKVSEAAAATQAAFTRLEAAVGDITGDIQVLNDKITALQNSSGELTPEDQVLLDAVQAHASALADKFEALAALTPAVAPPA